MESMELVQVTKVLCLLLLYLKAGPVHVHAGAVDVEEPLQICLWAGGCDRLFQLSVHRHQAVTKARRC